MKHGDKYFYSFIVRSNCAIDWWPGEETGTLIIIAVRLSYLQAIEPLMKNLDSALIYLYA